MNWNKDHLKELPTKGDVIFAGDDRIERYCEDTMMRGSPDAVIVARDEQEISELLAYCNKNSIPVTFCGSQTSMTGASVPTEGLLISTEKLEGIIDISKKDRGGLVTVRPGTIVADLQKAVAEAGYFYPVAPTSRDECRIGSNISTNATGEDSYRYGPARRYVKSIELILADGSKKTMERGPHEATSCERNRAGYFTGWKNPIDMIIGSEGTLAYISNCTLELLHASPEFFTALIPFQSNMQALRAITEIALKRDDVSPRALEFIDSGALTHMKMAKGFPKLPDSVNALLYVKQEFSGSVDDHLMKWFKLTGELAGRKLADHVIVAQTRAEQEDFRLWRHHIPESANELGRSFWENGGGKVGSDWWVPIEKLLEMMEYFYSVAESTGLPYMGYAHVGSGHPHTNFIASTPELKKLADDALIRCCCKAVELGGGVSGEHGIGKVHADLLAIQHKPEVIEKMKGWKREYDPNWILGRGNIFS